MQLSASKATHLVERTRHLVSVRLEEIAHALGQAVPADLLAPGKMLRTRLAARLAGASSSPVPPAEMARLCAAIEIVHTASLCHDDVVDGAPLRRSRPSLWKAVGVSGALLVGDLLFCDAVELVAHTDGGTHLPAFLAKSAEVVRTEAEQELVLRNKAVDEPTCLRLARGKTGPLFAYVASLCGGADEALSRALEQAGYDVGTAYQMADDMLDVFGDESQAGKTLGTDRSRGKGTLPQQGDPGRRTARDYVRRLCAAALGRLGEHPALRESLTEYLREDFQPVLSQLSQELDLGDVLA
jgi:heptaprenyl diphosphate synthase